MKILKITLIIIFLTLSLNVAAQSNGATASFSIHQDAKFAFVGDKTHGYDAGTLDLLARVKFGGNQGEFGYTIVFLEFEYAEILGTYKRYSVNAGHTFNKLFLDDIELSASLGYGWIDRYGKAMFSFSGQGEVAYKLTDRLKLSLVGQLTERKDLKWLWGKNEIKPSLFFGLEYQFK